MTFFRHMISPLLIVVMGSGTCILANTPTSLSDTIISIEEVTVSAKTIQKNDANQGARVTSISKVVLEGAATESLSELLNDNSMIYIKSMGQGNLATSSFRGTSSNHTQVTWNGVSINSPTLGNFDFSQIPAFFIDEVSLLHGSSNQKSGTGALGGTVELNNTPTFNQPVSFKAQSEYGSWNTFTEALAVSWGNQHVAIRSRGYIQHSDNDFLYLNKVLAKDPFYEHRQQANYDNWGFMQEAYFNLNRNNKLWANLWLLGGKRSLPQPIMVVQKMIEKQKSYNVRALGGHEVDFGNHLKLNSSVAFLYDNMNYFSTWESGFDTTQTNNRSRSLHLKSELTKTWRLTTLSAILQYRYDNVFSENYSNNSTERNTLMARVANTWNFKHLTIDGSASLEINEKLTMPTFSLGTSWEAIPKWLSAKGSLAYNYRTPTLNDLYWVPGGNPNLKPEKGFSGEVTLLFKPQWELVRLSLEASYYHMLINDWITWLPTDKYYWEPKNLKLVRSQGIELTGEVGFKIWKIYNKAKFNYSYSPAKNITASSMGAYGKQLPYVPLHKWNGRYQINMFNFALAYSISFTDKRYVTTDQSYQTNAYLVQDIEASYKFDIKGKVTLTPRLKINNLANTYYESTQYYPMPLMTINGSLIVTW